MQTTINPVAAEPICRYCHNPADEKRGDLIPYTKGLYHKNCVTARLKLQKALRPIAEPKQPASYSPQLWAKHQFLDGYWDGIAVACGDVPDLRVGVPADECPRRWGKYFGFLARKGGTDAHLPSSEDKAFQTYQERCATGELWSSLSSIEENLIPSRISLVDFTLGYLAGIEQGLPSSATEMLDNQCAFDMGKLKAAMDVRQGLDRSHCIVYPYNEVELECRHLGFDRYGWRSRTPLTREEAEGLGLDLFEHTPEQAAWAWIWASETTGSSTWEGGRR